MEYISGIDRNQCWISSLEDAIDENNPIRFIDSYVSRLDIGEWDSSIVSRKIQEDPHTHREIC